MTREKAIEIIEILYSADSEYENTRKIGIKLLEQAKRNIEDWRLLPDEILFEYCRLCDEYN